MNVTATTQTRITGSPTNVPVRRTRTVTYLFNTGTWVTVARSSEKQLKIPYEVAFDGVVQPRGRGWPQRIVGRTEFRIQVPEGTEVSLHLNTDALEGARRHPVYAVTPMANDVHVTINETRGTRPATAANPTLAGSRLNNATNRQTDYYTAPLHGNIWALVSRIYTAQEAGDCIPATADAGVRNAVVSIYQVLPAATLVVLCASPDRHRVTVSFADSDNPRQNVSNYELLRDGLTRVHPLGFYALIEAARSVGLTRLNITSCWRPSLGSIAHRAGIGLDVNIVADADTEVRINRAELIQRRPDLPWVSAAEPALYRQRAANRQAWTAEVNANMPNEFRRFHGALQASPYVQQLFDPWYMDVNTRDNVEPVLNEQVSTNEVLHNNHLHLTLNVPGVL